MPALLAAALAGCASVPAGDPQLDARLKTFAAPPGAAGLYVVRSEPAAPAVRMDVDVDGVPLGRTAAGTYLYRTLAPGRHTVTSYAENTATLEVEVGAGGLAFVAQEARWGLWQPRTRLRRLDADAGREAVRASRLALSLEPMQRIDVALQAQDPRDPRLAGPMACEASNPFGRWPFTAPGLVTVAVARAPLQITCAAPAGAVARATVPGPETAAGHTGSAARAGTAAGAGVGVAVGVAAAPVAGPALAVLLGLGGAMQGREAAALLDAATVARLPTYPGSIVVQVPPATAAPD